MKAYKPELDIVSRLNELEGKQDKIVQRPAFLVSMGATVLTAGTGVQNLVDYAGTGVNFFGTTAFDHNNNLYNGKFVAPVSGIYHFDLKLQITYSSGYMFSYVYVNGAPITNVNCQFYQSANVCTLSFTYYAKEGDYFEPHIQNNYAGGTVAAGYFSGHYVG